MKNALLSLFTLLILASCGKEHMPVLESIKVGGGATISNGSAPGFNQVKQIFSAKCLMCHNGSGHPKDWTNYETSKGNLDKLNNRLFVVGNMPAVGSLSASEKATVKAWIDAGGPLEGKAGPTDPTPTPGPTPTPEPTPIPTPLPGPNDIVGFDWVKPIFQAKCTMCHNGSVHPKIWTNYETSKNDLVKLNDRLFVVGNMPAAGSLSANEKTIIKAWLAAGGPQTGSAPAPTPGPTPTPNPEPTPIPSEAGRILVQNKCLSCHGSGAAALDTPVLHGQEKNYLVKQLNDFKTDARKDLIMGAMKSVASALSDDEIEKITSYLSSESACSVHIDVNAQNGNVEAGQNKANSCLGCHSAIAPVLIGQKTGYLKVNLNNFRNEKRINAMMNPMAKSLSDEDINDLAAYFNSKRNCK